MQIPETPEIGSSKVQLGGSRRRCQSGIGGIEPGQYLPGLDHGPGIDQAGSDLAGNAEGERDFVTRANLSRVVEALVSRTLAKNARQYRPGGFGRYRLLAAGGEQREQQESILRKGCVQPHAVPYGQVRIGVSVCTAQNEH
ncbi:MAG: hypothetical protein AW09_001725 [Candidatus Accumulibacter phosphatis]|uniref:Uncharacterized protein n=1 Tax=Candidatus Accumulibacter phosphatis TaxID=327160 RepID=A0A080LWK9_9PROT|nr:MAG: hypothetical protein AW09_001725 [Candidatus Accumulibacter phosphatis]